MLLKDNAKVKLYTYITDILIHFIQACERHGLLDDVIRIIKAPNSKEFALMRKTLVKEFVEGVDQKEMVTIWAEIEDVILKSSKDQQNGGKQSKQPPPNPHECLD